MTLFRLRRALRTLLLALSVLNLERAKWRAAEYLITLWLQAADRNPVLIALTLACGALELGRGIRVLKAALITAKELWSSTKSD